MDSINKYFDMPSHKNRKSLDFEDQSQPKTFRQLSSINVDEEKVIDSNQRIRSLEA